LKTSLDSKEGGGYLAANQFVEVELGYTPRSQHMKELDHEELNQEGSMGWP
jgi:hypothetical protein